MMGEFECTVVVDPGVCRLKTVIVAKMDMETMGVTYKVESDCASVRKVAEHLGTINPYTEIGSKMFDSTIYKTCNEYISHLACPVPSALVKATEVAGGLGLKRNVTFNIS